MTKRITLKDVAQKAGVSGATVSMVLHNDASISDTTKERILKIIKQMNYVPHFAARSLAGGKTNNIALVSSYFRHYFYQEILAGLESANIGRGYSLKQCSSQDKAVTEESIYKRLC